MISICNFILPYVYIGTMVIIVVSITSSIVFTNTLPCFNKTSKPWFFCKVVVLLSFNLIMHVVAPISLKIKSCQNYSNAIGNSYIIIFLVLLSMDTNGMDFHLSWMIRVRGLLKTGYSKSQVTWRRTSMMEYMDLGKQNRNLSNSRIREIMNNTYGQ